MIRAKLFVTLLLALSFVILTSEKDAAIAQVTFKPSISIVPPTLKLIPKVQLPSFNAPITLLNTTPDKSTTNTTPDRSTSTTAPDNPTTYSPPRSSTPTTIPASSKPKPRASRAPVVLNYIPLPRARPLLSLGRPALLDAARVPNMIAVLVAKDPNIDPAASLANDFELALVSRKYLAMLDTELILLRANPSQIVDEMVALLSRDSRVIGVQPDYQFELQQSLDNGPAKPSALYDLQYAPQKMAVANAHSVTMGENTIIAVIDTGVDVAHTELSAAAFYSYDAIGLPISGGEKHGTAIAGLIAADKDMMGIAPKAKFLAVRAFTQAKNGKFTSDSFTIANAIDWAVAQNAHVLNMSFAGPSDPLIMKMIDLLAERKILVVAAAGNHGIGAPAAYPAAHPHTIAVTATDARDELYSNANRGIYIDIAAPGVDVIAPAPSNNYELVTGTSIATAHLTGVIALMLSKKPELTRDQILILLQRTSLDAGAPGQDPEFGLGLVDAFKATNQL